MKTKSLVIVLLFGFLSSCELPPGAMPEDWNFPLSTKFRVTLYGGPGSVAINEPFEVKLVFYNIDSVFSAAVEMHYPSDSIQIDDIIPGPHFTPEDDILIVKRTEPDSNRVSYGVSYKAGSGPVARSSGVVMKLKCRGKQSGSASITINKEKLEIWKSDGMRVANLVSLRDSVENFTVHVR